MVGNIEVIISLPLISVFSFMIPILGYHLKKLFQDIIYKVWAISIQLSLKMSTFHMFEQYKFS